MKRYLYVTGLFILLTCALGCKKNSANPSGTPFSSFDLKSFSITDQTPDALIDPLADTIIMVIPHGTDMHNISISFTASTGTTAKLNGNAFSSGASADVSKPFTFTIVSSDQKQSVSFKVKAETDLQYYGINGNLIAEKSLNKSYSFYLDQMDGSTYQSVNCGPTVSTMALRWGDSTFAGTPAGARDQIPESGGWWYTYDIQNYLYGNGMQSTIDTIDNLSAIIKNRIDANNVVILCLDMNYVPYNIVYNQHVQKFYSTTPNWGHFLLVKGYKQTSTNFYLEIYDPNSNHLEYNGVDNNQLKGRDRYYDSNGINQATQNWWPYYIAAATPGQPLISSQRTHINSLAKPIPPGKGM